MQFKAVSVLALAATASASYGYGYSNVSYTTEVVTEYTTYCPEATQVSYNGQTYTVTEVRTLGRAGDGVDGGGMRQQIASIAHHTLAISQISDRPNRKLILVIAHLPDHHQLPLHHQQASLRHQLRGLQHLVCPSIHAEHLPYSNHDL